MQNSSQPPKADSIFSCSENSFPLSEVSMCRKSFIGDSFSMTALESSVSVFPLSLLIHAAEVALSFMVSCAPYGLSLSRGRDLNRQTAPLYQQLQVAGRCPHGSTSPLCRTVSILFSSISPFGPQVQVEFAASVFIRPNLLVDSLMAYHLDRMFLASSFTRLQATIVRSIHNRNIDPADKQHSAGIA